MVGYIDWDVNPVLLQLGSFAIRWYSLMWALALACSYLLVQRCYKREGVPEEKFAPMFGYAFVGILLGARLGHCLFYEFDYFVTQGHLLEMILPFKNGEFTGFTGLASHGGGIGVLIAMWLYIRKTGLKTMFVMDNIALATPMLGFFIRIGNLMNSEIIGSPTDVPWAFLFHCREAEVNGQIVPCHPSQLYEALFYGLTFLLLIYLYRKQFRRLGSGFYFGLGLVMIFGFRFLIEFIKHDQEEFESGMLINMGQTLSIPFVLLGTYWLARNLKKE